jgi:hypothetical protein
MKSHSSYFRSRYWIIDSGLDFSGVCRTYGGVHGGGQLYCVFMISFSLFVSIIKAYGCFGRAPLRGTARVFRSDSPGKVAQWLARSIHESWGLLWLVIRLLSVRADVSSSVIKAFFLVLHSPPHLSACWSSPLHYPYFSYSASEDCHV